MDYVKYIRSMVGKNKVILTASAAVIVRNGKILLQRRSDNNKWGLIGGIMEMGETFRETAVREVREETGLEVELEHLIGIYYNPDAEWASGDKGCVICAIYKANIVLGEPRIDEESLELKFFDESDLPELSSLDHKMAVADYLKGLKNQNI